MGFPRRTITALAAGSIGLASLAGWARGPDAATARSFAGKVVQVSPKYDPARVEVLVDVELRSAGGRMFLVGACCVRPHPKSGVPVWVAMDDVCSIVQFADLRDFERRAGGIIREQLNR